VKPRMTLLKAMADANLFGPWFKVMETWRAWLVVLKAIFALPMDEADRALFHQISGRVHPPEQPVRECWLVVGRRGGKSFIVALIAVYLACFRDYRAYLSPGERGVVMVLAADRKQARVIFRYIRAFLKLVKMLTRLVVRDTEELIELSNGIDIEIHAASYRGVRGYTIVAALLDELAFWRTDESANPDKEIVDAIRPAMATIPNALLMGFSSPYAKRGVLYEQHVAHFAREGDDVLVIQADSRTMNPTLPAAVVEKAYAEDPASAASEYGALFRDDISGFLNPEWVTGCTMEGKFELAPRAGVQYRAFVDPSGGASDAFTLAIAHAEDGQVVQDMGRAWRPPFKPSQVVEEIVTCLKRYGLTMVKGDRYSAEWVVEAFGKEGVHYEVSALTKSEIYLEAEPLFAQGSARILDIRTLTTQLRQLERRTARGGRDSIDHPPRGKDDSANAACGALVEASKLSTVIDFSEAWIGTQEERSQEMDQHFAEMEAASTCDRPSDAPWNLE
jgi:hypothetical protein